jgi:hypothetical protein
MDPCNQKFNLKYRIRTSSIKYNINRQKGMNQYTQVVCCLLLSMGSGRVRLSCLVAAYRAASTRSAAPSSTPSQLSRMYRISIKIVNTGKAKGKGEMNLTGQKEKLHMEFEPLSCPCTIVPSVLRLGATALRQTSESWSGSNTSWMHERFTELGDIKVGGESLEV